MTDGGPAVPTTWDQLRDRLSEPTFNSATRSRVGVWIANTLELHLGTDWPERASAASRLGSLMDLHRSNPAFFRHLTTALRLESVTTLKGRRPLLASLRRDFGAGTRDHVDVQLEIATLAMSCGWDVTCEERVAPDAPPLDIVIKSAGTALPVEVKVMLVSEQNRTIERESSYFDAIVFDLLARYDVILGGQLPGIPNELGRQAIQANVEPLAIAVQADHVSRTVSVGGVDLTVTWLGAVSDGVLSTMPGPKANDAARLPEKLTPKALQATKSGARWLRLELVSGYFQLSWWWAQPFPTQVDSIVADIVAAGRDSGFDGVVVSSGLVGPGRTIDETVTHSQGAVGVRRQVNPFVSRTTVVTPLTPVGHAEVSSWVELYASEPQWLDGALSAQRLPSVTDILRQGA